MAYYHNDNIDTLIVYTINVLSYPESQMIIVYWHKIQI